MTSLLHISSVLLLVGFLALPENTLGLSLVPVYSSSPASVDSPFSHQNDYNIKYNKDKKSQFLSQKFEKSTEQPSIAPESFISKQEEPQENEQQRKQLKSQFLPAVIPGGPDQPSSDILPPTDEVDEEFFVNVKSKPVEKTKRDSSDFNAGAPEMPQGRFLSIPGLINWGVGHNNNNNQKPGSCYRPNNNNYYTGQGYNNGYYNNNNNYGRVKRQSNFGSSYTPYNTNNGFGGGYPVQSSNSGGWQGGNYIPPGNNNGGWQGGNGGGGSSYCYRDNDCPGNKKCCSRVCTTPAFVG